MADKAGDRFTDSRGVEYELHPDPKHGYLRPYTLKSTEGDLKDKQHKDQNENDDDSD